MKVNGYQLREAIRLWSMRREMATSRFDNEIFSFPGEVKDPRLVMDEISVAEAAIAKLQTAQSQYNLETKVTLDGNEITLGLSVRLIGGASRVAKYWKDAVGERVTRGRYGLSRELTRDKDSETAEYTIPVEEMRQLAEKAAAHVGELREAIAAGNATIVDIDWLYPELFE